MRRARERAAVVLPLALSIAACAPMTSEVFRPAAPGGRLVKTACPPVDAVMLFERGGIRIAVDASSSSNDTFVRVMFEVPEGRTVRFPERAITVSTPRGDSATAAPQRYRRGAGREFPLDTAMVGEKEPSILRRTTPYGRSDHAFYLMTVSIPIHGSDTFTVTLPRLRVNDADVELPAITFTRTRQSYIASLNC